MHAAENYHLLHKRASQDRGPLEVFLATSLATLAFGVCYQALCFDLRYKSYGTALLIGPILFLLISAGLANAAYKRRKYGRKCRFLVLAMLGLIGGAGAGTKLGEMNWWKYTVFHFNYHDMVSYVNVDPGEDVGTSFMDAGTIYFKESTYVLARKALAFHNGATYCVAPIVRQPVQLIPGQANPNVLETVTGFAAPRSGTIDFWAVGKDCCGNVGTDNPPPSFTCGQAASHVARSGMRLLNNHERDMYLLAVQEWSASTGLPVRHPLFFTWVKDPVTEVDGYYQSASNDFWHGILLVFVVSLIVCFVLQVILQKFQIH